METTTDFSTAMITEVEQIDSLLAQMGSEQRTRLATYLRRYIAPNTALALFRSGNLLSLLEDQDLERATVVLGDLRGFVEAITSHERHGDDGLDRISKALGQYAAMIRATIFKYGGVFAELAGDQFIGVFGAYVPHESDALKAVAAAIEIIKAKENFASLSEDGIGIAVCTGGRVRIGDIPSHGRTEFAVIGSLVSRAARVQEVIKRKEYREIEGVEIFLDENSHNQVSQWIECKSIGKPELRSFGEQELYKLQRWTVRPDAHSTPTNQDVIEEVTELTTLIEGFPQREIARRIRGAFTTVAKTLSVSLDIEEVIESVVASISQVIVADKGSVWLLDERGEYLELQQTLDPTERETLRGVKLPMRGKKKEGIIVWVVKNQESAIVNDAQKDERFFGGVDERADTTTRSVLCVPMIAQGRAIGAIELIDERAAGTYDDEHRDLLTSVATSAAIAIQNARALVRSEDRARRLKEIADTLGSSLDIEEVIESVVASISQVIVADKGSVWLLDERGEYLELQQTLDPTERETLRGVKLPMRGKKKEGIIVWVVKNQESAIVNDAQKDERFFGGVDERADTTTRSVLCVPMIAQGRAIGAIELIDERAAGTYNDEHRDLLTSVATSAAIAIQNARQLNEIHDLQRRNAASEMITVVGTFAGKFMHTMNNKIGIIPPLVQKLQLLKAPELREDTIEQIDRSAREALTFIETLRESLRVAESSVLDVNSVVSDVVRALKPEIGRHIQLDKELCRQDTLPVLAYESSLREVVRNLLQNAVDALEGLERGHIWVRTGTLPNGYIGISVQDTGKGIEDEYKDKIFTVGFTTKQVGKGLGVGLWWIKSYVESLGGEIHFASKVGEGTTFTVTLKGVQQ